MQSHEGAASAWPPGDSGGGGGSMAQSGPNLRLSAKAHPGGHPGTPGSFSCGQVTPAAQRSPLRQKCRSGTEAREPGRGPQAVRELLGVWAQLPQCPFITQGTLPPLGWATGKGLPEEVTVQLSRRSKAKSRGGPRRLLTGLFRCDICAEGSGHGHLVAAIPIWALSAAMTLSTGDMRSHARWPGWWRPPVTSAVTRDQGL